MAQVQIVYPFSVRLHTRHLFESFHTKQGGLQKGPSGKFGEEMGLSVLLLF